MCLFLIEKKISGILSGQSRVITFSTNTYTHCFVAENAVESIRNGYGGDKDRTNLASQNFSATIDLSEKRQELSPAELLGGAQRP